MTKQEFRELTEGRLVFLDGATGSNLQKAGMPTGVCPEQWIMDNPECLINLQKSYLHRGTDIIYAPTFSANRIKLAEYGLEGRIEELNRELVGLSKRAVGEYMVEKRNAEFIPFIAGDVTMTGKLLQPLGPLSFEEAVDVYKEQMRFLAEAGVDLFVIETMMSLQETRAALIAAGEVCDLPVMVTMTFDETAHTLYGTEPETAVLVLQGLGADAVGVNCGAGPEKCLDIVRRMKSVANVPVIAKPNAGMPSLVDGETVYDRTPEEFAKEMKLLAEAGAGILGGCCGTTPDHIAYLYELLGKAYPPHISKEQVRALTNERRAVYVDLNGSFLAVGERINPTGKKKFQEALRAGDTSMAVAFAREQEENGAAILDINVGMGGIDEKEMMCRIVEEVCQATNLPLSIDTSDAEVMEAALRLYPGRALVNSVSLEEGRAERLFPLVKKYGAMVVVLPLGSNGLPKDATERRENLRVLVQKAAEYGIPKESIVADGLVMTVGAEPQAALDALDTVKYCKEELEVATTCGLSNISYGLPERGYINTAFLMMAIANGLTMAIVNPNQDLLMNLVYAADVLRAKEDSAKRYIERAEWIGKRREEEVEKAAGTVTVATGTVSIASASNGKQESSQKLEAVTGQKKETPLMQAVLRGEKKAIVSLTEQTLKAGKEASVILEEELIPAITEAGNRFEQKKYFLPQLIGAAEAMKAAVEVLEPQLQKQGDVTSAGTVIIATVEGDIHDIGKNLVTLMLKNHGFTVVDLGKDVSAERIVTEAKRLDADVIALSALMTTTMRSMADVIGLCKKEGVRAKVMIGGAVTTEEYAKEIGADGYAKDAQGAVTLAKRLAGGQ
ncbi:MAG: homocysteine S-methyltransferase family protein [Lachnospiraceae bacterium]|nr:homocysteine S-methyltransferase family protein [Lachnospiraceae bacterium]